VAVADPRSSAVFRANPRHTLTGRDVKGVFHTQSLENKIAPAGRPGRVAFALGCGRAREEGA
jgi:hypothetical protein